MSPGRADMRCPLTAACSAGKGRIVTQPPPFPGSNQGTEYDQSAGPQRGGGLATAALVFGICTLVPGIGLVCGPVAIVLAIIALNKKTPNKGFAVGGLALGAGVLFIQALLFSILLPALSRARELAQETICLANMNGLGKGIILYQTENEGRYPPNLEVLAGPTGCPADTLKCPSAQSDRACDYFYIQPVQERLPRGDFRALPYDAVIACDMKGNHVEGNRAVLYSAGNCTRLTAEEFAAELRRPVNAEFAAALRAAEGP